MTRLPAAQRKEQLLDVAVKLFSERGYAGATTADLAKAAGVTEPIIYRHFDSKKDLFIAVIDRTSQETIGTWERQLRGARDAAQRLRRLIAANPLAHDRGRGIYRVLVQAMMEIEEPDILAAIQRHVQELHKFVSAQVVVAQQEGLVSKAFSPEITAWTLLHLGLGYGILAPLNIPHHAEDDRGMRVRDVVELLMLGEHAKQRQDEMMARRERGDVESELD
ncbi:MAG: TetR/AcrR family transcriptional regulator [Phycisphaerales bacterium]|nr:TetR/AcrR family transcriptional regulator [Phycisphaerales bacterium]